MLYDPRKEIDKAQAIQNFNKLIDGSKPFRIEVKQFKRTLNQNDFWHLCIDYAATQMQVTKRYMSDEIFKRYYNKDIFEVVKTMRSGKQYKDLKSSKELTVEEMAIALTRVINGLREDAEIVLPDPDQRKYQMECEIEVEKNKYRL